MKSPSIDHSDEIGDWRKLILMEELTPGGYCQFSVPSKENFQFCFNINSFCNSTEMFYIYVQWMIKWRNRNWWDLDSRPEARDVLTLCNVHTIRYKYEETLVKTLQNYIFAFKLKEKE